MRAALRSACLLVVGSLGAAVATCQPAPAREPWVGSAGLPRQGAFTHELGLSDRQQDRIEAIREGRRSEREALHAKIAANRDALHALLESGTADAGAVGDLVLEGRRLEEQVRALRDAELKAIREVLTPDQRKKLDRARTDGRGPDRGPGTRPGDWPRSPGGGQGRPGGGPGSQGPRAPFSPGQQPLPW